MPSQLTGLDDTTFLENTVNETPQLIDATISYGTTGSLNGGTLVVSGLLPEDVVSILAGGNITYDSGTGVVRYLGTIIGTATGGVGADLVVTFNANASYSAVDQLIERLAYANTSDTPTATRDLTINVTVAGGEDLTGVAYADLAGAANPFDGIAVGSRQTPTFGDLDGDGDLDAVVGMYTGTLSYYENTGTAAAPVFVLRTSGANPFDAIDVGFSSAPELADLDGDSDLDLVVGDQDGLIHYFENSGGSFTEPTGANNPFEGIDVGSRATPDLADLDGDGDLDMVSGSMSGPFFYFENTGTDEEPAFTERSGAANPFNDFGGGSNSKLRLIDLDGDGDLDGVLLGLGSMVYLQNTGTTAAPVFAELFGPTNPFNSIGSLDLYGLDIANLDGDSDREIVGGNVSGVLHYVDRTPYAAPTVTITVTAESDDPVLLDFGTSFTFAENTVNATPQVIDGDLTFRDWNETFDGGSLTVSGLAADDIVSIQAGGLIGYNSGTGEVSYGGVVVGIATGGVGATFTVSFDADATEAAVEALIEHLAYANSSDTPTANRTLTLSITDGDGNRLIRGYDFVENTTLFASVSVGTNTSLTFGDMDGDGDLDAIAGAYYGGLHYLENTGSDDAPAFVARTGVDNPLNGVDLGFRSNPELADVDGDGDLDLVAGRYEGDLRYFENTGSNVFVERTGGANPFTGLDVGGYSTPSLTDVDGDGDLDVVSGNYAGNLVYFENTGSLGAPVYVQRTGVANPFDGIDVGFEAAPDLADVDGDGDFDLVVGQRYGNIHYFENTGTALAPVFVERTGGANPFAGIDTAYRSTPELADMDDDGDWDVMAGGQFGLHDYSWDPLYGLTFNVTVTAEDDIITGTGGGDALDGTGGDDIMDGGAGDDVLGGGDGDDTIEGGDGADYIKGGAGADAMAGGAGDDTYVVDNAGDTTDETGGDGQDLVLTHISWTLADGVDNLTLGAGGREIDGTGNDLSNVINGNDSANVLTGLGDNDALYGRGGADTLHGGDGDDYLDGGRQDDVLTGGANDDTLIGDLGNDLLDGGTGVDDMAGGAGHDSYVVDDENDTITEAAGGGTDTVESSAGAYTLSGNVEMLVLTGTGDSDGTGNAGRNTLTGNSGANTLDGGGEIDTIDGGGGHDSLLGGAGNDILDGGLGDDTLVGGAGGDKLTGGAGGDTFLFGDADIAAGTVERDQILDLSFGDGDVIDLSGIDANTTLGGDQGFVWAAKFTKVAGQAILKYAGGVTTLELDVDGDGRADFRVAITGDHTGTTGNLFTGGGDANGGWIL